MRPMTSERGFCKGIRLPSDGGDTEKLFVMYVLSVLVAQVSDVEGIGILRVGMEAVREVPRDGEGGRGGARWIGGRETKPGDLPRRLLSLSEFAFSAHGSGVTVTLHRVSDSAENDCSTVEPGEGGGVVIIFRRSQPTEDRMKSFLY